MKIHVLRPYGSSGFVLEKKETNQYAVVDMGVPPGMSFMDRLNDIGIGLNRITLLALTHLHSDHASEDGFRTLLEQTHCRILIPQTCWEQRNNDKGAVAVEDVLIRSNRMILLSGSGESHFGNYAVRWVPLSHQVNGMRHREGNLSYRIDTTIISGDGPVRELFSDENVPFFKPDASGPVKIFAVNIAHADNDDLGLQAHLSEERKERYRNEHGMLADLIDAMRNPVFREFFQELEYLIPTHIRRKPLAETLDLFTGMIEAERASQGFAFSVSFG